jgi:hypothetical protein
MHLNRPDVVAGVMGQLIIKRLSTAFWPAADKRASFSIASKFE